MSAIWGLWRFDGDAVEPRVIDRMGAAMAARGVDGRATFVDGAVGLGHALMRVTREDSLDQQPLHDRDARLVIVADCRIDNRAELADALGINPPALDTLPDSALVLRAYRAWGDECAARLVGDFAFAVWDVARRRLLLARDHMGQRQLHYHVGPGFIVFATDIAALWAAPEVPRTIDEVWLGHFANRWRTPLAGRTALAGIRGVCGGTTIEVTADGAMREHRYWSPHPGPAHVGHDEAYYVAAYRGILEEAVSCRIRRLVDPPGLSLSGGFDSAAIAGLAGPALGRGGGRLITATSVMPPRDGGWPRDPRPWVERCARAMPHVDPRYVDYRDAAPLDGLESAFAADGGAPVSPLRHVEAAQYAALRSAGVRLAMDGHGGDHALNDRGQMALAHLAGRFRLRALLREMRAHRRVTGESWRRIVGGSVLRPLLPHVAGVVASARRGFARTAPLLMLKPAFVARLVATGTLLPAARLSVGPNKRDTRVAQIDLLTRMSSHASPALAATAAAHGLELTRPFYDKRVIEFALAVPQDLDVRGGRNRYLACTALADVYPAEFLTRPRHNDGVIDDPLSLDDAPLRDAVTRLATSSAAAYFDLPAVAALLDGSGKRQERARARRDSIRTILFARYVAWIESRNS